MNLNNLVKASIFTSIAIGLGFFFMLIPNLEFISITVFLAGLTLGASFGAIVGCTSMLIYSVLNPLGSGLIYLPLLISQILAMGSIGVVGAISRLFLFSLSIWALAFASGFIGIFCAVWYDGITTLAYPISAGYNWDAALAYSISGIMFTFMHIFSNAIIFSVVIPGYINRITN